MQLKVRINRLKLLVYSIHIARYFKKNIEYGLCKNVWEFDILNLG